MAEGWRGGRLVSILSAQKALLAAVSRSLRLSANTVNRLHIGFSKVVDLPKSSFLFIHDELPALSHKHARIFDPAKHSLNPLHKITYKRARDLADVLYAVSPQGENTLTVRNGRRALLKAFLEHDRFDRITDAGEEVEAMIDDLLVSPVLKSVLCNPTDFSFNAKSIILARINRAELGDFDALVLGLVLIGHFKGQVVVPDFGFYGRDAHISLIRENRLIAGVNFLDELPPKLRRATLLIKDKRGAGAIAQDADLLATYAGLTPGVVGHTDFVQGAMSAS